MKICCRVSLMLFTALIISTVSTLSVSASERYSSNRLSLEGGLFESHSSFQVDIQSPSFGHAKNIESSKHSIFRPSSLLLTDDQHDYHPSVVASQTLSKASFFRNIPQVQPLYFPKEIFNSVEILVDAQQYESPLKSPWFIQNHGHSKNRLSAWKDGNSIYASRVTYC